MSSSRLTDAEIRALGWQALVDKLGFAGAVRFAIQTERGFGDYSESRHKLLGQRSVDELIRLMRDWKKRSSNHATHRRRR